MPNRLISLLYVSQATATLPHDGDGVAEIVEVAQSRNRALDVTGALIFTGAHFAQLLEGRKAAVDELMESIFRDPRHRNVEVVEVKAIASRRFASWSLAYAGPSLFVDRHIRPLVERCVEQGREKPVAQRLIGLMHEFVSAPRPA